MKKLLTLLLAVLLLLSMAACGAKEPANTDEPPRPTTSVSTYKAGLASGLEASQRLSWETLKAQPIKRSDMTPYEARALCVDYFRFAKTALWMPDEDLDFIRNSKGSADTMEGASLYGGLPYVGVGSGNLYRLMDYMDDETGVVQMSKAADVWKVFGNQCSIGAYWGWCRAINSAKYTWTQTMVERNGFIRVGDYEYDLELTRVGGKTNDVENPRTPDILRENGQERMYKAYAEIKLGDGLVYYTTAGHVIMSSCDAHVEYDADGKIDPAKSYITIIDQGQTWYEAATEAGQMYQYKGNVDQKKSFEQLFAGNYMPFTFAEFLGTDPIEDTVCEISHKKETMSVAELWNTTITCNYGISDIYALVRDAKGNEVYKLANRCTAASTFKMTFIQKAKEGKTDTVEFWGYLEPELTAEDGYTIEIYAQIGTGERFDLYKGALVS